MLRQSSFNPSEKFKALLSFYEAHFNSKCYIFKATFVENDCKNKGDSFTFITTNPDFKSFHKKEVVYPDTPSHRNLIKNKFILAHCEFKDSIAEFDHILFDEENPIPHKCLSEILSSSTSVIKAKNKLKTIRVKTLLHF